MVFKIVAVWNLKFEKNSQILLYLQFKGSISIVLSNFMAVVPVGEEVTKK